VMTPETTYATHDEDYPAWAMIPTWVAQQPPTLPTPQYDEQTQQTREALVQVARQVRALHAYCPAASDEVAAQMRAWLAASGALEEALRRHMMSLRQTRPPTVSRRSDAGSVQTHQPQVFTLP